MPEPDVGTDPWNVPDGGYFADSGNGFFDGMWDFARGIGSAALDWVGSEREWDRTKWLFENGYTPNTAEGGVVGYGTVNPGLGYGGGMSMQTLLIVGGLGAVLLFVALKK